LRTPTSPQKITGKKRPDPYTRIRPGEKVASRPNYPEIINGKLPNSATDAFSTTVTWPSNSQTLFIKDGEGRSIFTAMKKADGTFSIINYNPTN